MIDSRLRILESKFLKFRSQFPPKTRIPFELRQEVLEAISAGVRPSAVALALSLSSDQIKSWRKRMRQQNMSEVPKTSPRVLEVVSSMPPTVMPAGLRISFEGGRLLLELSC